MTSHKILDATLDDLAETANDLVKSYAAWVQSNYVLSDVSLMVCPTESHLSRMKQIQDKLNREMKMWDEIKAHNIQARKKILAAMPIDESDTEN
jgi:heme exporter protein D